jgi:hypothetical protein
MARSNSRVLGTLSQLIKEDIMDDISIPAAPAVEVG